VLVIATPCPLILAPPIALLGGVSAAARRRIIVKRLAALEVLARVDAIVLDKTGTITLGRPALTGIELLAAEYRVERVLGIAEAIERNSLHPIAKTIVAHARSVPHAALEADEVEEAIGAGIAGTVGGRRYVLARLPAEENMAIELRRVDGPPIAIFRFDEEIKPDSRRVIGELKRRGFALFIFTGDRLASALRVAGRLGEEIGVRAECTPEDKQRGLEDLKREGRVTAMVGDGINDAPALALADVGMVFSNEEQTASSEAADVVFLDGDIGLLDDDIRIASRTLGIARLSILWGIGLSEV
jgi:cation transport ATPase